jgi:hypothetical protein
LKRKRPLTVSYVTSLPFSNFIKSMASSEMLCNW